MGDPNTTESSIESVSRATSSHVAEAFSALGNETRLSILVALWDAYDPFDDHNAVSFSDLFDSVELRDSGQFNYHLEKLTGQFIRKRDDGYELRRSGQKIVRAVIAGSGLDDPAFGPAEIDLDCWLCGAQTAVTYQDEWLYHVCTECDGLFTGNAEEPDGYLGGMTLDPAGLEDRTPEELLAVSWIQTIHHLFDGIEGFCTECSGEIVSSLHVCGDHDADGLCSTCGRRVRTIGRFRCSICKAAYTAPPHLLCSYHPAVVGFYNDHGINLQYGETNTETFRAVTDHVLDAEQTLISGSPPQVRVTFRYDDAELSLTLDEHLNVIEASDIEA